MISSDAKLEGSWKYVQQVHPAVRQEKFVVPSVMAVPTLPDGKG
jgi:hypothetical protein